MLKLRGYKLRGCAEGSRVRRSDGRTKAGVWLGCHSRKCKAWKTQSLQVSKASGLMGTHQGLCLFSCGHWESLQRCQSSWPLLEYSLALLIHSLGQCFSPGDELSPSPGLPCAHRPPQCPGLGFVPGLLKQSQRRGIWTLDLVLQGRVYVEGSAYHGTPASTCVWPWVGAPCVFWWRVERHRGGLHRAAWGLTCS